MGRRDLGLRREQERSADLHAGSAEREGGYDAARVRDAARRDHRHFHGIDHLRDKCKGADLGGKISRQEHAAMAAGLVALRHDGIDAARLQPARFGNGRG